MGDDAQRIEKEIELNAICTECLEGFSKRNPGCMFPYGRCERCSTGRELHNLEKGSAWDNAPFASTKWGK